MKILLTNDDGIYSPGLHALKTALSKLGDVYVVAPQYEQSGVGLSITYLHPLIVRDHYQEKEHYGWAVAGSPADCVKLGVLEFCGGTPDLVVSGINTGTNAGINVLYSGTVAGAIEGAFFGITSVAVSTNLNLPPDFDAVANRTETILRQLLEHAEPGSLWNLNFPENRPEWPLGMKVTGIAAKRYQDFMEKRQDPRGRSYYWSGIDPIRNHEMTPGTDLHELTNGYITLTPLHFDLTEYPVVEKLQDVTWKWEE